jgi:hypothetical protein
MPSRLGEPAPQAKTGAARFAAPTQKKDDILTAERVTAKTLKRQKQPMTIRLTPEAIDKLSELERDLRRAGLRARRASASEIVEALLLAATPDAVQELLDQANASP